MHDFSGNRPRFNGPAAAVTAAATAARGIMLAGGFGTYVAMSTAMSSAAGAIGVTLPFVAYTTAATALSIALGPVGLGVIGIGALMTLGLSRKGR